MMRPLARSFYERSPEVVARALLGKIVVYGRTSGRIVETEAYLGIGDLASHSACGPTPRNRVMFGPPGHAYVYFIYGMYECLNVVTEPDGVAGGVLIRALEPLTGLATMRRRRQVEGVENLTNGPGKLTQALGIGRDCNGLDVTRSRLKFVASDVEEPFEIGISQRIGISKSIDLQLRFFVKGSKFVSHR